MTRAIIIGSPLFVYLLYKSKALKFTNIARALKVKTLLKECIAAFEFFKRYRGFQGDYGCCAYCKSNKDFMLVLRPLLDYIGENTLTWQASYRHAIKQAGSNKKEAKRNQVSTQEKR